MIPPALHLCPASHTLPSSLLVHAALSLQNPRHQLLLALQAGSEGQLLLQLQMCFVSFLKVFLRKTKSCVAMETVPLALMHPAGGSSCWLPGQRGWVQAGVGLGAGLAAGTPCHRAEGGKCWAHRCGDFIPEKTLLSKTEVGLEASKSCM